MKFSTKKQKEEHLNNLYFDCFSLSQAIDNFEYLTSKLRYKRTTLNQIIKCYNKRRLGSLLRRLDSIAFECA